MYGVVVIFTEIASTAKRYRGPPPITAPIASSKALSAAITSD